MSEGYIGLAPAYGFFNKQNIAGSAATTYNLDFDVVSANGMIVSLDGIVQEPGYAFSVGRSAAGVMQITFAEALPVTTISSLTFTAGSSTITGFTAAQVSNLVIGQGVTGNSDIPADTFVASKPSTTTITLTNASTASGGSNSLTFGTRIYIVYLGNVLQTASSSTVNTQPLVEYFSSDGTAQSVSLGRTPPTAGSIAVYLDGVFQRGGSGKAYTLSGGAITFTGATPAGGSDNITVFHLATEDNRVTNQVAAGAVTNAKLNLDYSNVSYRAPTVDANFAATTKVIKAASGTVNYGVNDVLVFLNGVCLTPTTDYTISATTMTLVGGAPPAGSNLVVRYLPLTG
jgi:hypothetical protein